MGEPSKAIDTLLVEAVIEMIIRNASMPVPLVPMRPTYIDQSNMGIALHQQGRYAEALPYLDRAIEMNPCDVLSHFYRGRGLRCLGRHHEALLAFGRVISLDPSSYWIVPTMAKLAHVLGWFVGVPLLAEIWHITDLLGMDF